MDRQANSMRGLYLGPDAVDLEAVYEQGKLVGLQETQCHADTIISFETEGNTVSEPGTSFAELFEKYATFGITFVETEGTSGAGNVYYNGQLVSRFADLTPGGGESVIFLPPLLCCILLLTAHCLYKNVDYIEKRWFTDINVGFPAVFTTNLLLLFTAGFRHRVETKPSLAEIDRE